MWSRVFVMVYLSIGSSQAADDVTMASPPEIIKQPTNPELPFYANNNRIEMNDLFFIECEAVGMPTPRYNWTKNGKHFDFSRSFERIAQKPGEGTLIFAKPNREDSGIYQCFAYNDFGIATTNSVIVREITTYTDVLLVVKELAVKEGDPITLHCNSPKVWPEREIYWLSISAKSSATTRVGDQRHTVDDEGSLHFSNVTLDDGNQVQKYNCMAAYRNKSRILVQYKLYVEPAKKRAPILLYSSNMVEVAYLRSRFNLYCIFGGLPLPNIMWLKNGKDITESGPTLRFSYISNSDEGNYTCEVSNGAGSPVNYTIALLVRELPFISWINDVQRKSGDKAVINCKVMGNPRPHSKWFYNSKPIEDAVSYPRMSISEASLTVFNVTKEDTGVYGCNTSSPLGYDFKAIRLLVKDDNDTVWPDAPRITMQPTLPEQPLLLQQSVKPYNVTVTIECNATGTPEPKYTWMKDGNILEFNERITQCNNSASITIERALHEDAGRYQCFATNKWGTAMTNAVVLRQLNLTLTHDTVANLTAKERTSLVIPCHASDVWMKLNSVWMLKDRNDNKKFLKMLNVTITDPLGNLVLTNVFPSDGLANTEYTCQATLYGLKFGRRVHLTVESSNFTVPRDPFQQYTTGKNKTVLRGQTATLFCVFGGNPIPDIKWKKNGIPFNGSSLNNDVVDYNNMCLRIKNVTFKDAGNYTCEVSNGMGFSETRSTMLVVKAAPFFVTKPKNVIKHVGESADIWCRVDGDPKPLTQWIHNGLLLNESTPNPRRQVEKESIKIIDLRTSDTGNYGCRAVNVYGNVYKDVYVNVVTSKSMYQSVTFVATVATVAMTAMFIIVTLVMMLIRKRRHRSDEYIISDSTALENLPDNVDRWELNRDRILLLDVIGEGNFGRVYSAETFMEGEEGESKQTVAVKTLKLNASDRDKIDLMEELLIMKGLGKHLHVVRLIGCCTLRMPIFVIMELADQVLLKFLQEARELRYYEQPIGGEPRLTSEHLLSFGLQIARGLEYISSCKIVHRDLAARNILLTKDMICKIADFGLARDVSEEGRTYVQQSRRPQPIRWMAPESLRSGEFSTQSDVWSLGVVLWELLTLGCTPYPGKTSEEVAKMVVNGEQLPRPVHCSRALHCTLSSCWEYEPRQRPAPATSIDRLADTLTRARHYLRLDHFPHHYYTNVSRPHPTPSVNTNTEKANDSEESL